MKAASLAFAQCGLRQAAHETGNKSGKCLDLWTSHLKTCKTTHSPRMTLHEHTFRRKKSCNESVI